MPVTDLLTFVVMTYMNKYSGIHYSRHVMLAFTEITELQTYLFILNNRFAVLFRVSFFLKKTTNNRNSCGKILLYSTRILGRNRFMFKIFRDQLAQNRLLRDGSASIQ